MIFHNLKNKFDYYLRQKLKFKRGFFPLENEVKNDLFKVCPKENKAQEEEQRIYERYKLDNLKNNCTIRNYLENLYIIELLESVFNLKETDKNISILDIGSKNWFYAQGEYQFFKHNYIKKEIKLTGVEIDAYRVYSSLFSRFDSAIKNIDGLENVEYIADNLLNINKKYDYITWFFPFVIKEPLLHWGLPMTLFKPQELLLHAYSLLNKNGQMLIMNQGEKEYQIQKNLLSKNKITFIEYGEFQSDFIQHEHQRYYLKVIKR
ncbi:MAG: hypothetical protein WCK67_08880 [bacterium]